MGLSKKAESVVRNNISHYFQDMTYYLFYRLKGRIFRIDRWVIMARELTGVESEVGDVSAQSATHSDIDRIINVLPYELVGYAPASIRKLIVERRFKANIPCYVVKEESRVIGGCWTPVCNMKDQLAKIGVEVDKAGEITTLFVTPKARGRGIAATLCDYACKNLATTGFDHCVSLVWYSRPASIRAHIKAGFKPVGEKSTYSFLGFRWSQYRNSYRQIKALQNEHGIDHA